MPGDYRSFLQYPERHLAEVEALRVDYQVLLINQRRKLDGEALAGTGVGNNRRPPEKTGLIDPGNIYVDPETAAITPGPDSVVDGSWWKKHRLLDTSSRRRPMGRRGSLVLPVFENRVCNSSVELVAPYSQREGHALALFHHYERMPGWPDFKGPDSLPVQVVAILKPAIDLRDPLDVCYESESNQRVSRIVCGKLVGVPLPLCCCRGLDAYYYDSRLTRWDDFVEIKVGALASGRRYWPAGRGKQ